MPYKRPSPKKQNNTSKEVSKSILDRDDVSTLPSSVLDVVSNTLVDSVPFVESPHVVIPLSLSSQETLSQVRGVEALLEVVPQLKEVELVPPVRKVERVVEVIPQVVAIVPQVKEVVAVVPQVVTIIPQVREVVEVIPQVDILQEVVTKTGVTSLSVGEIKISNDQKIGSEFPKHNSNLAYHLFPGQYVQIAISSLEEREFYFEVCRVMGLTFKEL